MQVLVDATALGSGLGGDETMLRGLLSGLAVTAEPDDRIDVLAPAEALLPVDARRHPQVHLRATSHLPGAAHFGARLPSLLRRWPGARPDAVVTVTHAPASSAVPVAVMVQDLSFHHHPEHYPRAARARLRTLVPRQARRAAAVLTVSEHARAEFIAPYDLDPGRVHHVPNVVARPPVLDDHQVAAARAHLAALGAEGPSLLYLGNLHPRKNVAAAIRAFTAARAGTPALADHRLVIAGARWWGAGEERAVAEAAPGSVVLLGRVDDVEKEVLLRDARALVYVSLFEGFGLPPLEAMARSTPVVAARATSLPEVCGDAAVLVDPHDVDDIAAGIVAVLTDDDVADRCVAAGHGRAAAYRPERTGAALRHALASVPTAAVAS